MKKHRVTSLDSEEFLIPVTGEDAIDEEEETSEDEEVVEAEETTQIDDEADDGQQADVSALQAQIAKLQQDINKQKSSYQRKENEQLEREKKLRSKLDELMRSGMSEDEAKVYERNKALEELEETRTKLEQVEQERQAERQFNYWRDQFVGDYGLSRDQLVLDQGLEELVASGMAALKQALKGVKENKPVVKKAKAPNKPPETLKPIKGDGEKKLTLTDLAKEYADGDIDKLYELWGQGMLDRSLFAQVAESYDEE